ncbi:DoxX family protein [Brevundimonas sp. Root1423]|uniref:DoxX family protein n=1 Tax=Brevundimonas sp. Root1423 TaxID=1736462 RepID=UPI0006F2F706|nr:DoxX family protein [Brevundimonas sp. Root1423]KQY89796.1 DoxX family protein [Brevundimonas sp. Root1423]
MNAAASPRLIAALLEAPGVALIGRILLTSPFWISGLLKLADFQSAVAEASHFGLQPAVPAALAVILLQIGGSLAVIVGRGAWVGAGALGVFTVLANVVGHAFWALEDPMARFHDMNAFIANVGLIGGLVLAAILAERHDR